MVAPTIVAVPCLTCTLAKPSVSPSRTARSTSCSGCTKVVTVRPAAVAWAAVRPTWAIWGSVYVHQGMVKAAAFWRPINNAFARTIRPSGKDTRVGRAQTRINLHPQALVVPDPSGLEPHPVDIGHPASRDEERIHHGFASLSGCVCVSHDFERSPRFHRSNFCPHCYLHPIAPQRLV